MKKQKSEDYSSYALAYRVAPFFLVIFIMAFAITFSVSDSLYKENLKLHSENADLWCKSQRYEKVIEPEKSVHALSKGDIAGVDENGIIHYILYGTNEERKAPEGAILLSRLDIGIRLIVISAKTETRSFETGYYNETDNSYYCQAEPILTEWDGNCINTWCKQRIEFLQFVLENAGETTDIQRATNLLESCKRTNQCQKIEYQKSEKFPYE